jgi:uncharacterized membrane protein HdeD (DUF308 family)
MKQFIRNLEEEYLVIVFLIVGILLILFPAHSARIAPYLLGGSLVLRGSSVVILSFHYKEKSKGPGGMVLYCATGLTFIILGNQAIGIIGVIWAVYSLMEVSEEIDEMWKEGHYSVLHLVLAVISIALAVMLMVDPFEHFATHIRILGLEIITSCLARGVDTVRARIKAT